MFNRSPQMEAPQRKKGTNYDDNSYDSRSGSSDGCQGCECKQQNGNGQVTCTLPNGKKIGASMPAVLT